MKRWIAIIFEMLGIGCVLIGFYVLLDVGGVLIAGGLLLVLLGLGIEMRQRGENA
jgi:hypothetical protein